jgi:hypothetical protein
MTDRELLEAAARAEGHAYPWVLPARGGERPWNPLTDDGDALRLAVKLRLWVGQHEDGVTVSDLYARFKVVIEEDHGTDPYAATRRAIVRAAAEIGRSMT